ncbi:hypothetical protein MKZ26_03475 [Sporosarcina sp. FSL K6-6792]
MKSKMQKLHEKLIAKGVKVQLINNFRHKKTTDTGMSIGGI